MKYPVDEQSKPARSRLAFARCSTVRRSPTTFATPAACLTSLALSTSAVWKTKVLATAIGRLAANAMDSLVAILAKGNQVSLRIVSELAPGFNVVHLKLG